MKKVLTEAQQIQKLNFFLNDGISLTEAEYLDQLIGELDEEIEVLDEELEDLDEEELDELTPRQRELKRGYKQAQQINRGFGSENKHKDPLTYGRGNSRGRPYTRGRDPKRTANSTLTKGSKYKKASKSDTNRIKDMIKHNHNGPSGNTAFMPPTGGHKKANLPADRGQQAIAKQRQVDALKKKREQLAKQRQKLDEK